MTTLETVGTRKKKKKKSEPTADEAAAAAAVELVLGSDLSPAHHAFPAPLILRRSCGCN